MTRNIFITGASRGIGRALAERFLSNGDFVIGTSITGQADFQHDNLIFLPLDLSFSNSIVECLERFLALDKKIDVVINNAGILLDDWNGSGFNVQMLRDTLKVNLISQVDLTEKLLASINKGGQIVNVSSILGSLTLTLGTGVMTPAYSISKTALNMYTKTLSERLKGQVLVSSVHPGNVKTDLNEEGTISPREAAEDIFKLVESKPETGQFWFKGRRMDW